MYGVNISTRRLIIREMMYKDAMKVYLCMRREKVAYYSLQNPKDCTLEGVQYWINNQQSGAFNFVCINRFSGELIGCISLNYLEVKGLWELGYCIDDRFWGNGYANEIMRGILDWSKMQPEIETIWAKVAKSNKASISVVIKFNFDYVEEGYYYKDEGSKVFPCYIFKKSVV